MLDAIKSISNSLGWIPNFVRVILGIAALVGLIFKAWKYYTKYVERSRYKRFASVSDYVIKYLPDKQAVTKDIVTASHVAIVDDELSDYPVAYLKSIGLKVDSFDRLSLADIPNLTKYRLVLLDIVGVVPEQPNTGGLEVIKRLTSYADRPLIIAVSGKTFDPTLASFFQQADDVMKKPVDEKMCEEHVVSMLEGKYSPYKLAIEVDNLCREQGSHITHPANINVVLLQFLHGSYDESQITKKLEKAYSSVNLNRIVRNLKEIKKWIDGRHA